MTTEEVEKKLKAKAQRKENRELRELIRHAWVHTAYPDCGFMKMTTEQKKLYCKVIGCRSYTGRINEHLKHSKNPKNSPNPPQTNEIRTA